jgi:hypothetical protein
MSWTACAFHSRTLAAPVVPDDGRGATAHHLVQSTRRQSQTLGMTPLPGATFEESSACAARVSVAITAANASALASLTTFHLILMGSSPVVSSEFAACLMPAQALQGCTSSTISK